MIIAELQIRGGSHIVFSLFLHKKTYIVVLIRSASARCSLMNTYIIIYVFVKK